MPDVKSELLEKLGFNPKQTWRSASKWFYKPSRIEDVAEKMRQQAKRYFLTSRESMVLSDAARLKYNQRAIKSLQKAEALDQAAHGMRSGRTIKSLAGSFGGGLGLSMLRKDKNQ